MIVLWILLYVIGFVVTTIVMKYFKLGTHVDDMSWWAAIVLWPVFVPCAILILAVTEGFVAILSRWDEASDKIVEKLRGISP